jgi:hypothetical protein
VCVSETYSGGYIGCYEWFEVGKGNNSVCEWAYSGVILIVRNGLKFVRVIIVCVSETYSGVKLNFRNGLKLGRVIIVCVSDTYIGAILIVRNGLK